MPSTRDYVFEMSEDVSGFGIDVSGCALPAPGVKQKWHKVSGPVHGRSDIKVSPRLQPAGLQVADRHRAVRHVVCLGHMHEAAPAYAYADSQPRCMLQDGIAIQYFTKAQAPRPSTPVNPSPQAFPAQLSCTAGAYCRTAWQSCTHATTICCQTSSSHIMTCESGSVKCLIVKE